MDEDREYAHGLSYDDEENEDGEGQDSVEFDVEYDDENCYSLEDPEDPEQTLLEDNQEFDEEFSQEL